MIFHGGSGTARVGRAGPGTGSPDVRVVAPTRFTEAREAAMDGGHGGGGDSSGHGGHGATGPRGPRGSRRSWGPWRPWALRASRAPWASRALRGRRERGGPRQAARLGLAAQRAGGSAARGRGGDPVRRGERAGRTLNQPDSRAAVRAGERGAGSRHAGRRVIATRRRGRSGAHVGSCARSAPGGFLWGDGRWQRAARGALAGLGPVRPVPSGQWSHRSRRDGGVSSRQRPPCTAGPAWRCTRPGRRRRRTGSRRRGR